MVYPDKGLWNSTADASTTAFLTLAANESVYEATKCQDVVLESWYMCLRSCAINKHVLDFQCILLLVTIELSLTVNTSY